MHTRRWLLGHGVLLSLALLGLASPVRASMVEAMDLAALVKRAEQVVVARVMSQWSHYDDHGRIVTDVQMQVERVEKGDAAPGASVVVRRLGGVVDGIGMRVEGEPSFDDGELVLLFGTRLANQSVLRPVGMSQGTMRVVEELGERWVRSRAQGLAPMRRDARGTLVRSKVALDQPRKLEDVLSEIRALVAAQ